MPPKFDMDDFGEDDFGAALGGMLGVPNNFLNPNFSKEFMAKLPAKIRDRVNVLLELDEQHREFVNKREEGHLKLLIKYEDLYKPIFKRRDEIVSGTGEPVTEEEVKKGMPEEHVGQVEITGGEGAKGITDFWLRALQHNILISQSIQEHDEPVLKHLTNITRTFEEGEVSKYTITFHFSPNDYFENETLSITQVNIPEDPKMIGTEIKWKPGKNLTVTVEEKKQRAKRTGQVRVVKKEVPQESFFRSFLNEEAKEEEEDEEDEDAESESQTKSYLFSVILFQIIPNAIDYYTGEAPDGDDELESVDEEEEEEEEEEEPVMPARRGRGRGRGF